MMSQRSDDLQKAELCIKGLKSDLDRMTANNQRLEKEIAMKHDELKLSENRLHVRSHRSLLCSNDYYCSLITNKDSA